MRKKLMTPIISCSLGNGIHGRLPKLERMYLLVSGLDSDSATIGAEVASSRCCAPTGIHPRFQCVTHYSLLLSMTRLAVI